MVKILLALLIFVLPGFTGMRTPTSDSANHLACGSDAKLDNLGSFTVCGRHKPDATSGDVNTLVDKDGWTVQRRATNGALGLVINNATTGYIYSYGATALPTTGFTQWCATWDGTWNVNGISIYFEGVADTAYSTGSSGAGPEQDDSAIDLWLGGRVDGVTSRGMDGNQECVAIWNSVLTADQIKSVAEGDCMMPTRIGTDPVALYLLQQGTVGAAYPNEPNVMGGTACTIAGSVTVVEGSIGH